MSSIISDVFYTSKQNIIDDYLINRFNRDIDGNSEDRSIYEKTYDRQQSRENIGTDAKSGAKQNKIKYELEDVKFSFNFVDPSFSIESKHLKADKYWVLKLQMGKYEDETVFQVDTNPEKISSKKTQTVSLEFDPAFTLLTDDRKEKDFPSDRPQKFFKVTIKSPKNSQYRVKYTSFLPVEELMEVIEKGQVTKKGKKYKYLENEWISQHFTIKRSVRLTFKKVAAVGKYQLNDDQKQPKFVTPGLNSKSRPVNKSSIKTQASVKLDANVEVSLIKSLKANPKAKQINNRILDSNILASNYNSNLNEKQSKEFPMQSVKSNSNGSAFQNPHQQKYYFGKSNRNRNCHGDYSQNSRSRNSHSKSHSGEGELILAYPVNRQGRKVSPKNHKYRVNDRHQNFKGSRSVDSRDQSGFSKHVTAYQNQDQINHSGDMSVDEYRDEMLQHHNYEIQKEQFERTVVDNQKNSMSVIARNTTQIKGVDKDLKNWRITGISMLNMDCKDQLQTLQSDRLNQFSFKIVKIRSKKRKIVQKNTDINQNQRTYRINELFDIKDVVECHSIIIQVWEQQCRTQKQEHPTDKGGDQVQCEDEQFVEKKLVGAAELNSLLILQQYRNRRDAQRNQNTELELPVLSHLSSQCVGRLRMCQVGHGMPNQVSRHQSPNRISPSSSQFRDARRFNASSESDLVKLQGEGSSSQQFSLLRTKRTLVGSTVETIWIKLEDVYILRTQGDGHRENSLSELKEKDISLTVQVKPILINCASQDRQNRVVDFPVELAEEFPSVREVRSKYISLENGHLFSLQNRTLCSSVPEHQLKNHRGTGNEWKSQIAVELSRIRFHQTNSPLMGFEWSQVPVLDSQRYEVAFEVQVEIYYRGYELMTVSKSIITKACSGAEVSGQFLETMQYKRSIFHSQSDGTNKTDCFNGDRSQLQQTKRCISNMNIGVVTHSSSQKPANLDDSRTDRLKKPSLKVIQVLLTDDQWLRLARSSLNRGSNFHKVISECIHYLSKMYYGISYHEFQTFFNCLISTSELSSKQNQQLTYAQFSKFVFDLSSSQISVSPQKCLSECTQHEQAYYQQQCERILLKEFLYLDGENEGFIFLEEYEQIRNFYLEENHQKLQSLPKALSKSEDQQKEIMKSLLPRFSKIDGISKQQIQDSVKDSQQQSKSSNNILSDSNSNGEADQDMLDNIVSIQKTFEKSQSEVKIPYLYLLSGIRNRVFKRKDSFNMHSQEPQKQNEHSDRASEIESDQQGQRRALQFNGKKNNLTSDCQKGPSDEFLKNQQARTYIKNEYINLRYLPYDKVYQLSFQNLQQLTPKGRVPNVTSNWSHQILYSQGTGTMILEDPFDNMEARLEKAKQLIVYHKDIESGNLIPIWKEFIRK